MFKKWFYGIVASLLVLTTLGASGDTGLRQTAQPQRRDRYKEESQGTKRPVGHRHVRERGGLHAADAVRWDCGSG